MEYFRSRFRDYLNENWPVAVDRFKWETAEVFEAMAPAAYEASYSEWQQGERQKAVERAREFLEETGCDDRFRALLDRHSNQNVVPFVGAGMSIPSGFLPWGAFLLSLLADAPQIREQVRALIAGGQYEEAAQVTQDELSADAFSEEINSRLGRHKQNVDGPVALLPELFEGEVITTNFDYVISNSYNFSGKRFSREISGSQLRAAPKHLGEDRRCLLRLHGEASDSEGRVLTLNEYNSTYSDLGKMAALFQQLSGIRSFLFLGCSLASDRTLDALTRVKSDAPVDGSPHYAFLPLPPADERTARRQLLGRAGIHPIYYPRDSHDQCIEDMLIALREGRLDD